MDTYSDLKKTLLEKYFIEYDYYSIQTIFVNTLFYSLQQNLLHRHKCIPLRLQFIDDLKCRQHG